MSSPESAGWPTNTDDLAAIACDASRPAEQQYRAFQELRPAIARVVGRLAARFAGVSSDATVDEALGEVWLARQNFTPGRPFEPWCYGVLRNSLLQQCRSRRRERSHRADVAVETVAVEMQRALERALDGDSPLPPGDLAAVREWPVAQRLAVLALSGLSRRVPGNEWLTWVGEYEATHERTLPEPFPPEAFGECESRAERNAILCEAMKVPRNTLAVWLSRRKSKLRSLQCVRDLMDNA